MARKKRSPSIDSERLRSLFDGVNAFGRSADTGGYDRRAFSDADVDARRWFADQMEEAGLTVHWDEAGNLFGRWGESDAPAIMAGSHLDTVVEGGAFDGTLGVCVALESVRAMKDAGVEPAVPVEVAVTSDEEGRFGGMLGSQAIAGKVTREWIDAAADADGVRLADAMARQSLDSADILKARRPEGSVRAFLELHIEQGPTLETGGKAIGIVEAVSGICNWQITLTGIANHSGTTPMDGRADAFAGLAEIAATIPSVIRIVGDENSRVTIGKVDISPNHSHTIPGRAAFNLIIRDPSDNTMKAMAAAFRALIERVCKSRNLEFSLTEMGWIPPVDLDIELARTIEEEASRLELDYVRMPSGAGHDAQTMQGFCPSALIFVPSAKGISHAPEEWTEWADIERGAKLYLATLCRLCRDETRTAAWSTAPEKQEPAAATDENKEKPVAQTDEEDDLDIDFDFELDEADLNEKS